MSPRRGPEANNFCGSCLQCAYPQEKVRTDGSTYHHKCGQCLGCRVTSSESWAVRNILEAVHSDGEHYMVSLTYIPEHLPLTQSGYPTTQIAHVRDFIKRFRRKTGLTGIKYFGATEYGKQGNRPHCHVLLMGLDSKAIAKLPAWRPSSEEQAKLDAASPNNITRRYNAMENQVLRAWRSRGFIDVRPFNHNRAAYVTKYLVKGDVRDGDLHPEQEPEDRAMSKGLGKTGAQVLAKRIARAGFALPENQNPDKWTEELGTMRITNDRGKTRTYPMPKYVREIIVDHLGGDNRTDEQKLADQVSKHKASLLRPFTHDTAKAEKAKRITIKCLRESGEL